MNNMVSCNIVLLIIYCLSIIKPIIMLYRSTHIFPKIQHNPYPLLLTFTALAFAQTVPEFTITHLSSSSQQYVFPQGSQAGGQTLYLRGYNFPSSPAQVTVQIGSYPCSVVSSSSMLISCVTSAATTKSYVNVNVSVLGMRSVVCTASPCRYGYSSGNTPVVQQIFPRDTWVGEVINVLGMPTVSNVGDGLTPYSSGIKSILVDDRLCIFYNLTQLPISTWTRSSIACRTDTNLSIGEFNLTFTTISGSANMMVDVNLVSLFNWKVYNVRLSAQVNMPVGLSHPGLLGHIFNLTANSIPTDMSLYKCQFGSYACWITSATSNLLTVKMEALNSSYNSSDQQLGKDPNDNLTQEEDYLGNYGFRHTRYQVAASDINSAVTSIRTNASRLKIIQDKTTNQLSSAAVIDQTYMEYIRGYMFIINGTYDFEIFCDDSCIVYQSTIANTTNKQYLQRILYHPYYSNSNYNPFRRESSENHLTLTYSLTGYYYTEIYTLNTYSVGFYRLNIITPPLSQLQSQLPFAHIASQNATLSSPAYQIVTYNITSEIKPEIIVVTVTKSQMPASNNFTVRYGSKATGYSYSPNITLGDNSTTFKTKICSISSINGYDPLVTVRMYNSFMVPTNDSLKAQYYKYSLTFYKTRLPPDDSIIPETIPTNCCSVAKTQNHSPVLSGTYRVLINGTTPLNISLNYIFNVSQIPVATTDGSIAAALAQFYSSPYIKVEQVTNTQLYDQIVFTILYLGVNNPLPFQLDVSGVSAGTRQILTNITINRPYSSNTLMYQGVPMQFLRIPQNKSSILITYNNIPLLCRDCFYQPANGIASIILTAILTSNKLVITLQNAVGVVITLDDIQVELNTAICGNLNGSIQNFTCQMPTQNTLLLAESGYGIPIIHITQIGFSDNSNIPPILIDLLVSQLAPTQAPSSGGTIVSIQGQGFPRNQQLANSSDFSLMLCGTEIRQFQSLSVDRIVFMVPVKSGDCVNSSYVVYKMQNASFQFSYFETSIALYSLSQYVMPALNAISFTIYGDGLDTANLSFYISSPKNQIKNLTLKVITINKTSAIVHWQPGFAGSFQITASFNQSIISNTSSMTFNSQVTLTAINPLSGSMGGGYQLEIYGQSFIASEQLVVLIGRDNICPISQSNSTYIKCIVPAISANSQPSELLQVKVVSRGVVESKCTASCLFYYDQTLTAFATMNLIEYNASDIASVNLINSSFIQPLTLIVDGIQYDFTINNNTLFFQYPALQQGFHTVKVLTNGSFTYPLIRTYTPLNFAKGINALNSVSVAGKIVNITGNGMRNSFTTNLVKVTLVCGGVVSAVDRWMALGNTTQVVLNSSIQQNCTLNYSQSQQIYKGYNVVYKYAATPAIELTQNIITNYTLSFKKKNLTTAVYQLAFLALLDSNGQQTATKYFMNISANGINVTLTTEYLPAGAYRLYAHSSAYGFAVIVNPETILICNFIQQITASEIISGLGGGTLTLYGKGFITDNLSQNQIWICGRKATISSANQSQLTLDIPAFATAVTYGSWGIGEVEMLRGVWFGDNASAIVNIGDSNISSNYYSSNGECFIGVDMGSQFVGVLTKIQFIPNTQWQAPATFLFGSLFQASNDTTNWHPIYQPPTPFIHSFLNYWLNDNTTASYRYFRFRHNSTSMCQLASLSFYGYILHNVDDSLKRYSCNVSVRSYNQTVNLENKVIYDQNLTSIVTKVWPQYVLVDQRTLITITGSNFRTPVKVIIDGVECQIANSSVTQIVCLSGVFSGSKMSNHFEVLSSELRSIIKCSPLIYARRYSDYQTWKGYSLPINGQNLTVGPFTNLLIDVNTSQLNQLTVTNSYVIVSDSTNLLIRANSITLNNAVLLIGSETNPYGHQVEIQMLGGKATESSVICNNCQFRIYGQSSSTVWTQLAQDVAIASKSIVLSQAVNWKIGDRIVLATSSYDKAETEIAVISSISNDGTLIQVFTPFKHFHSGSLQNYDNTTANFRAEVGLLTRNVRFTNGNAQTGYHLTFIGTKEKGLDIKMKSVQLSHCGISKLGKSCINIQNAEEIKGSYLVNMAIHDTYSRMITVRSSDYLEISNCLGYNIHGNGITLQDGSQTNTKILNNLIINTHDAYETPHMDANSAAYFISHPYNRIEANRAAGGGFYGFLLSFPPASTGTLSIADICPQGSPLLKFSNNTAHSFANFGFRIYMLSARQFAFLPTLNQSNINPYSDNPSIKSEMSVLLAYRNGVSGFLAENIGNSEFSSLILCDNVESNLQIHQTNLTEQPVIISNSWIIGLSSYGDAAKVQNSVGVITARSQGLQLHGIGFFNFINNMSTIQSCSQCQTKQYAIVAGVTTTFSAIRFVNCSSNVVTWNTGSKDVFYDRDASLTAQLLEQFNITADQTYLTPYIYSLYDNHSCFNVTQSQWNNSLLCLGNNSVRIIQFQNPQPFASFLRTKAKTFLLDSPYQNLSGIGSSNFSVQVQSGAYTYNTWAMRFLSNRYYNVHWDSDYLSLNLLAPAKWNQNQAIIIRLNTTLRQFFYVGKFYKLQLFYPELRKKTIIDADTCLNGQHFYDSEKQYLFVCLSARNRQIREIINLNTSDCLNLCPYMISSGMERFSRYWSNQSQWPGGVLPQTADNVIIPYEWNVVMDVDPPELNFLEVNGNLIFDRSRNNSLTAHLIWVNSGKIWIGSSVTPFINNAQIILKGDASDPLFSLNSAVKSRKSLVVTGGLELFGMGKSYEWSALLAPSQSGSSVLALNVSPDWSVGDQVLISCSFANNNETEVNTISGLTNTTIILQTPLLFDHYGSNTPTISNSFGTLDTRSLVAVVTRNIKIIGDNSSSLGGSIVITSALLQPVDSPVLNNKVQTGYANMSNVQIINLGDSSGISAVNLVGLSSYSPNYQPSLISHSSIRNCSYSCLNITASSNITISNNVLAFSDTYIVIVSIVDSFVFSSNLMFGLLSTLSEPVAMYYQAQDIANSINITNNVASGSALTAYVLPLSPCNSNATAIANNSASSSKIGFILLGSQSHCSTHSISKIFACQLGIYVRASDQNDVVSLSQLMMSDNHLNFQLSFSKTSFQNKYYIQDSFFSNFYQTSCPNCYSLTAPKLYHCANAYLIDIQYAQNATLNISQPTFEQLKPYYPHYASLFLISNKITNYFANSSTAPLCTNAALLRWQAESFANYPQINLINTTCSSCTVSNWLDLKGYANETQNIEGFLAETDSLLTGTAQALIPFSYWTNNPLCKRLSNQLYSCPLSLHVRLKFESIAPDYLNRTITPITLQESSSNLTVSPIMHQIYLSNQSTNLTFNRFVSPLLANHTYSLTYADSPPIDSYYQLTASSTLTPNSSLSWLRIKLQFDPQNFASVYVTNASGTDILVNPLILIDSQSHDLLQKVSQCGANIFFANSGMIEFIVNSKSECAVRVAAPSYFKIQTQIELNSTNFNVQSKQQLIIKIAAALGVSADRVQITQINGGGAGMIVTSYLTAFVSSNISSLSNSHQGTNHTAQKKQFQRMEESLSSAIQTNSQLLADLINITYKYQIVVINQTQTIEFQPDSSEQPQPDETTVLSKNANTMFEVVMGLAATLTLSVWCITICRSRQPVHNMKYSVQDEEEQAVNQTSNQLELRSTVAQQL